MWWQKSPQGITELWGPLRARLCSNKPKASWPLTPLPWRDVQPTTSDLGGMKRKLAMRVPSVIPTLGKLRQEESPAE